MMQATIRGRIGFLICLLFPLPTYGAISETRKINKNKLVARFARREKVKIPICIVDMIAAYSIKLPLPMETYTDFLGYVKKGNIERIKLLFKEYNEYHIDLEIKDKSDKRPLHWAASKGRYKVVAFLLEQGADIEAKDKWEKTPLHIAAIEGHKEVVLLLLEKGADIGAKDDDSWTPLHLAVWNAHEQTVELLLNNRADREARDNKGRTPLHLAAIEGDKNIVKSLIAKGGNIGAKDDDSCTPLHLATCNAHKEIVELLKKHSSVNDKWCLLQ